MSTKKHIKIIVAGGGTGGHIFPAVAIANAVKQVHPDADILFVGANGKMEMDKVPKEGYKIVGLDIAGFNRSSLLKNFTLPFKIIRSFLQAKKVINDFRPDAVVGVGGYASFPVLYMAQRNNYPSLLQEQNSYAGKSNKILGKKASCICVAYDDMERFFPKEKIVNTGNPVRQTIAHSNISKSDGVSFFHLNPNQKIVFAFGGSLGARSINEALLNQFQEIIADGTQLIWQTGAVYYERAKEATKNFQSNVKVYAFLREMDYAYAAADIIISRAGASSISELCIVAKPVIFVPFPFASEDHQTHNAMALVQKNAAWIVKDENVKDELISKLKTLASEENICREMEKNLKTLAIKDADIKIANKLMELIEN